VPWSKFNEHAWSKFNAQQQINHYLLYLPRLWMLLDHSSADSLSASNIPSRSASQSGECAVAAVTAYGMTSARKWRTAAREATDKARRLLASGVER
jgi:hypothetical protein